MEQYIVSARKYRPVTFRSVVGQESITSTLKNAIATHHLAHAYLFCGPRGVGKTTCARIFAKTINCLHPREDGEACDECESCRAFNEHGSFNIHELDAASNNTVDDIRSLVDQVRVPPPIGRYSVYIVDEVHMLSTAAFNAFLKTLEEPPAHAIFILATTEKHKIIPTILSRCQIYNFNRIKVGDTVRYLQYVAGNEGIEAEEAAFNVIAQKADGAMRDALSIFDQVVSFCGQKITYQAAIENLNVLDYDYYFKLIDAFLGGQVQQSLLIFDEILSKGFDGQYFISGLLSHLRDLLVSKDAATIGLLEVGETIAERYRVQAASTPVQFIYRALELANECDMNYRQSRNKRLLTEILLMRLCNLANGGQEPKKAEPELPRLSASAAPVNAAQPAAAPVSKTAYTPVQTVRGQMVAEERPVTAFSRRPGISISASPAQLVPVAGEVKTPSAAPQADVAAVEHCDFTDEELSQAWLKYAGSLEKEAHTTQTMRNFPPERVSRDGILMRIANSAQMEEMTAHRRNIERFLSAELHNGHITLTIEQDAAHFEREVFTPTEKLARMQEKNPYFKELRQKLGLEL
ncbi:MAG: DNA polymerase III subunit gamma/tau [bacterium]|uniref:DNA polymerase III subunit gamma/tau n=1 Tax=Candidatus Aphodosoma intestinipullorum TaxID=2840674 RepID=A0A940IDJ5_9BACT|nr:DNA polymerase III subunit gamma/tau [Candidatus Aphodosoma intestinipullorum]